jgi:4-deoxy-L-threo-5-hexosulose-uronate ketol-isomerase
MEILQQFDLKGKTDCRINHKAVISAPWSVHYGCNTSSYGFIWSMAGENKTFTDMDPAAVPELK